MVLRPIGKLIHADTLGNLPRIGRMPHATWHPFLDDLVAQFRKINADDTFSVALRGSVARGATTEVAADVDLVVFLDDEAVPFGPVQSNIFPSMPIEMSLIPRSDFPTHKDWVWMRFALAHGGQTIFGYDHLTKLPEPRLGPHCIAHLRNADRWLKQWQTYWDEDHDYLAICEWLMKRIVRSLFESQLMQMNAYSRDIYPCSQVAVQAFPNLRQAIMSAAELAVSPVEDREIISKITKQLSPILLQKQSELKK